MSSCVSMCVLQGSDKIEGVLSVPATGGRVVKRNTKRRHVSTHSSSFQELTSFSDVDMRAVQAEKSVGLLCTDVHCCIRQLGTRVSTQSSLGKTK